MSIEIEFDDVRRTVVGRVVIVIDVALSPSCLLVDLVSLVERASAELRRLPMTDEGIYR